MGNFPFAVPLSFTRHGFDVSEQEGQFQMAHPKSVRKRTRVAVNPNKAVEGKESSKCFVLTFRIGQVVVLVDIKADELTLLGNPQLSELK